MPIDLTVNEKPATLIGVGGVPQLASDTLRDFAPARWDAGNASGAYRAAMADAFVARTVVLADSR